MGRREARRLQERRWQGKAKHLTCCVFKLGFKATAIAAIFRPWVVKFKFLAVGWFALVVALRCEWFIIIGAERLGGI